MKDELGDRMKMYENAEAGRRLMPLLPILARIDGRAFHSFTRGMKRPYDEVYRTCMTDTTIELVKRTGALMGYTQSDEITLVWYQRSPQSQIWFDGRVMKMTSQLAAQATLIFYRLICQRMPEYAGREPSFDARVWNVPNKTEAANVFLWREWDATKNSLSMAVATHFSHKSLQSKNSKEKHDLLFSKGINWNDYPVYFKRGTYVQRRTVSKPFSFEEIKKLPLKHAARKDPNLVIERGVCEVIDMPIFNTVRNREDVIFNGSNPITTTEIIKNEIN